MLPCTMRLVFVAPVGSGVEPRRDVPRRCVIFSLDARSVNSAHVEWSAKYVRIPSVPVIAS